MQPETPGLLWDILDAGRFVLAETANVTLEEYERTRLLRSAIERELEIIGEAARRLSRADPDAASGLTDLPKIISFRNMLAHGYHEVDNSRVWDIIQEHLPALVAEAELLLERAKVDS